MRQDSVFLPLHALVAEDEFLHLLMSAGSVTLGHDYFLQATGTWD